MHSQLATKKAQECLTELLLISAYHDPICLGQTQAAKTVKRWKAAMQRSGACLSATAKLCIFAAGALQLVILGITNHAEHDPARSEGLYRENH